MSEEKSFKKCEFLKNKKKKKERKDEQFSQSISLLRKIGKI